MNIKKSFIYLFTAVSLFSISTRQQPLGAALPECDLFWWHKSWQFYQIRLLFRSLRRLSTGLVYLGVATMGGTHQGSAATAVALYLFAPAAKRT